MRADQKLEDAEVQVYRSFAQDAMANAKAMVGMDQNSTEFSVRMQVLQSHVKELSDTGILNRENPDANQVMSLREASLFASDLRKIGLDIPKILEAEANLEDFLAADNAASNLLSLDELAKWNDIKPQSLGFDVAEYQRALKDIAENQVKLSNAQDAIEKIQSDNQITPDSQKELLDMLEKKARQAKHNISSAERSVKSFESHSKDIKKTIKLAQKQEKLLNPVNEKFGSLKKKIHNVKVKRHEQALENNYSGAAQRFKNAIEAEQPGQEQSSTVEKAQEPELTEEQLLDQKHSYQEELQKLNETVATGDEHAAQLDLEKTYCTNQLKEIDQKLDQIVDNAHNNDSGNKNTMGK